MPVETLLVPWLATALSVRAVTELPADLQDVVPLVRLLRIGGAADPDNPRFDAPRVVIDAFAVGFGPAADLAAAVERAMRETLPGTTLVGAATVTRVDTVSGPSWVPYADTALRHFAGTYALRIKRR